MAVVVVVVAVVVVVVAVVVVVVAVVVVVVAVAVRVDFVVFAAVELKVGVAVVVEGGWKAQYCRHPQLHPHAHPQILELKS